MGSNNDLKERIRQNCKQNHESISASRYNEKGLTKQEVKLSSKNYDKMMNQWGLSAEQKAELKSSFEDGRINVRHASAGEKHIVTHGEYGASGKFVSKESLGSTPEERIENGALYHTNTAEYETIVVTDKPQDVLVGKIAAQPKFEKMDPKGIPRTGGGTQIVTNGGFRSGAVREQDPKYPIPVNKDNGQSR